MTARPEKPLQADEPRKLRVLMISHTCQSRTEGQPKAQCLGRIPDIDLHVLVPRRWKHYGRWRFADISAAVDRSYELTAGRVWFAWAGPAQFYLHCYPGLGRLLRQFKPDVIDLWEEPWGVVSAQTCWLRDRLLPTARIVSETEQNINKTLPPPFELFRRYVLSRAQFVVARSSEAMSVVRAKGYTGSGEVVPNAVDVGLFRPMDRDKCRAALRLSEDAFIVGYIGRLVEEKGIMDLVDAISTCPEKVRLLIAGDGPMRDAIHRRVAELGLSARVAYLGQRPLHELPPIMNALNVLALPSRSTLRWKEQFGRVIIEAHACGVPVIGTMSGAIPDVVGEAGILVRERDPADFARAICKMADQPSLCQSMGEAGRHEALNRFTWERVAEQMASIYRRTAINAGSSPADEKRVC